MKSMKNLARYNNRGQSYLGREDYECTALNQTLKHLLAALELERSNGDGLGEPGRHSETTHGGGQGLTS